MNWKQPKVYAVRHKNENVRKNSRSGGIFTALSDYVLEAGGVVYGCALTDDFNAVHIRAETLKKRDEMRGSKYIQSKLGDTFKNVKVDVDSGRKVLFSGTSCQIAGLKCFLKKKYENLLCVDIVCHGVPSKKVWNAYLHWQEEKSHSKVEKVDFRNKKDFGWRDHVETIYFKNGTKESSCVFRNIFLQRMALRPSCYECRYKTVMHPGDITIADYWGIEKAAPELDDNKGVSLVLVNNEFGERIFEQINNQIFLRKTRLKDSLQPALQAPFPKPQNREDFWMDFKDKPFGYIAKKYGEYSAKSSIKIFLKKIKRKIKSKVGEH